VPLPSTAETRIRRRHSCDLAKPLNYFQYGNPEVDRLMDEALWVPLCRRPENMISQKGIDGFVQNSYLPYIFDAATIKRV
jgi:peptide/nickel transport system substrate-binding protein